MLKLKRVEIHGFKSFYDKTEMKFTGSGITAVVGPNGCGKSNLSDAISWVLGEQSAKSLRGARMEDVIFAGTGEKRPLGMASVTMTLVPDLSPAPIPLSPPADLNGHANGHANGNGNGNGNGHHAPPQSQAETTAEKTGEVTITRRLFRSGESEYLINGKTARLRDIQDLFLGTGLGPESYAIIEQGRIGQILSTKPQDRRNVIEEAAGITKFKTRKRLAEAKLESAKQNLSRVFDILEEVTRQVNSLKRQAAKTKRYGELRAEALAYLRQVLAAKFHMLERETAKVAIELNLASTELAKLQEAIQTGETEQIAVTEASYANEQELTLARKTLADLNVENERARGKLEYQTKQIQQIQQRLANLEREAHSIETQQQEKLKDFTAQTADLRTLDTECTGARQQLETKAVERQHAQNHLAEREKGLEAARQSVLRQLGTSSGLKNRISQNEAQISTADRDTLRAQNEEQQSLSDHGRVQQAKAQISEQLSARQTELIGVTDQRKSAEQELQQNRTKISETRQLVDRLRGEFSRVKARRESLEEVIQHRSYTTDNVKRLFTAVEKGKAAGLQPVGVLADFLEVDPQIEKAAEEFLHDELEYVVVKNWEQAGRGIELLRADLNGRATFLIEHRPGDENPAELPKPQPEPGRLTRFTDYLRLTNGLSQVDWSMLPRIANCFIASDSDVARQNAPAFPHCWFLTPDGLGYQGQAVTGGKKSGVGPLALKRELREVTQLEAERQRQLDQEQTRLSELERMIARLTDHLEHLRTQQQAQEKSVLALDHESRKLAEEFQRIQTRLSRARLELDRIAQERLNVQANLDRDRAALAEAEAARAEQERALEAARQELTGLQADVAKVGEEHATLRATLAGLDERKRSAGANCARLDAQIRELANRRNNLANESERLASERKQFETSNAELTAKAADLTTSIAQTAELVKQLAANETEFRARLAHFEETLKQLRTQAAGLHDRRANLQVALARAEGELKHLEETAQNELNSTLQQLAEGVETIPDADALADLDAKYVEVRRKIEALGPVNPQALEEFEEAQTRQDFLNTQRQDLLDSIRDTEKAIQELDGESRKRFTEAFHAINANFREMFSTLFGGGLGEMRLGDEENPSDCGIDIVASPPGKRLQSVLLLSGGEKSLTAMALLMAIFQYTPSPFCILDEVDAPLDEPNIERLTKLLKDMAGHTQFIVITHSKRTMQSAQALYGVTMQEPGVSKLVSVRLNQPQLKASAQPALPELHYASVAGGD